MKKIVIFILLLLVSCGPVRYLPSETIKTVRDSIYVEKVDTQYVDLIKEVYVNKTTDTSSHLESMYSVSDAIIDTNGLLTHTLSNKEVKIPVQVVNTETIVYRDSVVYKEIPVEIEKEVVKAPKSYWFLISWFVFSVVMIVFRVKKYVAKYFRN